MSKKLYRFGVIIFTLFITLFLTAGTIRVNASTAKKLTVSEEKVDLIVGKTHTIKVFYDNNKKSSNHFIFESSNENIATVSSRGKIKAIKKGTCKITVYDKKNKKIKTTCKVIVGEKPKKIVLNNEKKSLYVNETYQLKIKKTIPLKASKAAKWESNNKKVALVSEKGKVTAIGKGTATITVKSRWNKKVFAKCVITVKEKSIVQNNPTDNPTDGPIDNPIDDPIDDPTEELIFDVSRGEWIEALIKAQDLLISKQYLNKDENNEIIFSYDDVSGNSCGISVESAVQMGILEQSDDNMFYPEKAATREFVAQTFVKALGYEVDEPITCEDEELLSEPYADCFMIQNKLFLLIDNCFCPDLPITAEEKEIILDYVEQLTDSEKIQENQEEYIEYYDNVCDEITNSEYEYSVSVNDITQENAQIVVTVSQNDILKQVEKNDVVVLPQSEEYPSGCFVRVDEMLLSDNQTVIVGTVENDVTKVISELDVEGEASVDWDDVKLERGVTITDYDGDSDEIVQSEVEADGSTQNIQAETLSASLGSTVYLDFSKKLEYSVNVGGATLTGYVNVAIDSIDYRIKADLSNGSIDECYLRIRDKLTVKGKIDAKKSGKVKIASIPIAIATGIWAELDIYVYYNANGYLEAKCVIGSSQGISYSNGKIRVIKEKPTLANTLDMKATMDLGPQIDFIIYLGIYNCDDVSADLASLTLKAGIYVEGITNFRSNGLVCMDANGYLHASLKIRDGCLLKKITDALRVKTEWTLYDGNNSPVKFHVHKENYKTVSTCTYGKSTSYGNIQIHCIVQIDNYGTMRNLSGVRVSIYRGNTLVGEQYTDANGWVNITVPLYNGYYTYTIGRSSDHHIETMEKIDKAGKCYITANYMTLDHYYFDCAE